MGQCKHGIAKVKLAINHTRLVNGTSGCRYRGNGVVGCLRPVILHNVYNEKRPACCTGPRIRGDEEQDRGGPGTRVTHLAGL